MRRDSERFPTWTATWLRILATRRIDWDTGRLTSEHLAAILAAEVSCPAIEVQDYMRDLCGRIQFFTEIGTAVRRRRARGGRQVLVTVNPDLFDEVVAQYSLLDSFDAVITSSSLGTDDKVDLCWRALQIMGVDDPSDTVLIDNVRTNIDGWVAAGGKGYLFTDDNRFAEDVARGNLPGVEPSDPKRREASMGGGVEVTGPLPADCCPGYRRAGRRQDDGEPSALEGTHASLLSEDAIKESLFDVLGVKDREWSLQLGRQRTTSCGRCTRIALGAPSSICGSIPFATPGSPNKASRRLTSSPPTKSSVIVPRNWPSRATPLASAIPGTSRRTKPPCSASTIRAS